MRSAGYNLAGQLLPLLVAVGSLPVVVRGLGPARFGLLALSWTVVGYFGLFDLGFGRAATQRIAGLSARGAPPSSIAAVASTVLVAQGALGVAGGLLLWAGSGWLASVLLSSGSDLRAEGELVLRILAAGLPAVLLANAYRAILEGHSRFDVASAVRGPFAAALFLVPLIGVLAQWTLVTMVAVLVASRWAALFVYGWAHARTGSQVEGRFDLEEVRLLARFGGWVALSNALIPAVVYLERIAVSALKGPEALGYYAAPHELMLKFLVVPAALTTVLYPLFSGFSARSDRGGLRRGLSESTRLLAVLVAPVAATFVLLSDPLLSWWLGTEYAVHGASVLRLLATAAFLNSLALVPFVLLEGTGRPDLVARYHLIEFPFYCLLLWLLVARFGIVGAAAAWLARVGFMTTVLYALALHVSPVEIRDANWRQALVASGAGLVTLLAAHAWTLLAGESDLVWFGLAVPAAHGLIASRWLLDAADRNWLKSMLVRTLPVRAAAGGEV